jgi:hypothetical protein
MLAVGPFTPELSVLLMVLATVKLSAGETSAWSRGSPADFVSPKPQMNADKHRFEATAVLICVDPCSSPLRRAR